MKPSSLAMPMAALSIAIFSLGCGTVDDLTGSKKKSSSPAPAVQGENLGDCFVPGTGTPAALTGSYGSGGGGYGGGVVSGILSWGVDVGLGFLHRSGGSSYGSGYGGYGGYGGYANGYDVGYGQSSGNVNWGNAYGSGNVNVSWGSVAYGGQSYANNSGSYGNAGAAGGQCTQGQPNGYGSPGTTGTVVGQPPAGTGTNVVVTPPGQEPNPPGPTAVPCNQPTENVPTQAPNGSQWYSPVAAGTAVAAFPTAAAEVASQCGQNGWYCANGGGTADQWPNQTINGAAYDQSEVAACFAAFQAAGFNDAGMWAIDVRDITAASLSGSTYQDSGNGNAMVVLRIDAALPSVQFQLENPNALYCVHALNQVSAWAADSCHTSNVAYGNPVSVTTSQVTAVSCPSN